MIAWLIERILRGPRPLQGRYTCSRFQPHVSWLDRHLPMPERPGYGWPMSCDSHDRTWVHEGLVRVVPTHAQRIVDLDGAIAQAEQTSAQVRALLATRGMTPDEQARRFVAMGGLDARAEYECHTPLEQERRRRAEMGDYWDSNTRRWSQP